MIEVNDGLKERQKLSLKDKFKFLCHRGLPCFGRCCSDVNTFLTPYDVLRMKNALSLTSSEFLEQYTITLLLKDQEFPAVVLKMRDDEHKNCPFITPEGCAIYEDRPWSCRMYPLEIVPPKTKEGTEQFCFIAEKSFPCLGFEQDKEWTVTEWLTDQEIDVYNKKSQPYMDITSQKDFLEGKDFGPAKTQMFYIAFYDLDRFRRHLFEGRFFSLFNVEEEAIKKIKTDDEELLEFGARWLKFSLFGENTISIKGEVLEGEKEGGVG